MFLVYAISSNIKNYIYVGLTNDLKRRIDQHQSGREKTTKPYRPFTLIYYESHMTRQAARKREEYLKSGIGKEWLKQKYK